MHHFSSCGMYTRWIIFLFTENIFIRTPTFQLDWNWKLWDFDKTNCQIKSSQLGKGRQHCLNLVSMFIWFRQSFPAYIQRGIFWTLRLVQGSWSELVNWVESQSGSEIRVWQEGWSVIVLFGGEENPCWFIWFGRLRLSAAAAARTRDGSRLSEQPPSYAPTNPSNPPPH